MRTKTLVANCFMLCLAIGLGCLTLVSAADSGTFHFRAYIDGSEYVYIQNAGGKVWYEHIKYDYVGEHSPYSASSPAATTIDGVDWKPVWNKVTGMSNTYTSSSPQNYPTGAWTALNINKITSASAPTQSRGPVNIVEYPSGSNSYTAKILINDDTGSIVYAGAAWYEFELTWEAAGSQSSGSPIDLTLLAIVAIIAIIAIAAILFVVLRKRKKTS